MTLSFSFHLCRNDSECGWVPQEFIASIFRKRLSPSSPKDSADLFRCRGHHFLHFTHSPPVRFYVWRLSAIRNCYSQLEVVSQASTTLRSLTTGVKQWHIEHLRAPQGGAQIPDNVSVRQRRIIYRSKQRGWLELDILFGNWAVKYVPTMSDDGQLTMTEDLLDADTPDVLKWVLRQQEPPVRFQNEIMDSLRDYASGDGHVNDR